MTWEVPSCRSDHFELLSWPNTSGIRLLSGFMQVRILPAAPLPGGVKVARRPVKPFGVGASPTLAANLNGKAGRYKLAAPVPKTGSATPRPEHYRRLPPFNHQTSGDMYDDSPIPTAVAEEQVAETCSFKTHSRKQKGTTGPADAAE
jgi:hypothetical protein